MAGNVKRRTSTGGKSGRADVRWGGISSEAVRKATGRGWDEWCLVLDKDKCAARKHRDIAALVHEKHGIGAWWSQMVTVGYEQARGLRQKHQKADGFSASASRVFAATLGEAYKAVADAGRRGKWLRAPLAVTKATPRKSVRIDWGDGTRVAVNFWDKSRSNATKTQVVFQHDKLKNAAAVRKMKAFWRKRLDDLGAVLGAE